ncbi:MAG: hypothetical protein JSW61_03735 [Candidatus Thorarchaeota archaeon]|nr:MAG: hypothetical protein JSW61_03735 [Candidatus Thorarchaeota archaeon]
MSTGQTITAQLRLDEFESTTGLTVFTPPGIFVETSKYPILWAGVLASPEPSEWLSIYDHPESWGGLDREAVLSMRRHLYRIVVPIDAREMTPPAIIKSLQSLSLSVAPVALGVEVADLPPRHLYPLGSQLPSGPIVEADRLELLTEPDVSRVARRITERDEPAADTVWDLLEYDYSLDQVARMMALGMLGRRGNRRIIPTRSAYKAVIDSFVDRAIGVLAEKPVAHDFELYIGRTCGDSFVVLTAPGETRVDYVRIESRGEETKRGTSIDGLPQFTTDSKTSVHADYARFSALKHQLASDVQRHTTIFHHTTDERNSILGPWLARTGVRDAMGTAPVVFDSVSNVVPVLESILTPDLDSWRADIPLLSCLGLENDAASPLVAFTR